jgi:hypothetical protein
VATRQRGGKRLALIQAPPPVPYGSKRVHSRRSQGLKAWKAHAPKLVRGLVLELPKPPGLSAPSIQMTKRTEMLSAASR